MDLPAVGVDIEKVARFAQVRPELFTQDELRHAGERLDSLAGIWCAKEAVVKAVSRWRLLSVREVHVGHEGGRPTVSIPGFQVDVSISHTGEYAVAFAVALPVAQDLKRS